MSIRQLIRIGSIVLLACTVVACGSDDDTTASGDSSSGGVVTTAAAKSTTAPDADSGDAKKAASSDVDCPAAKDALTKLIVNWQLVVQLPKTDDVAEWSSTASSIGTLSDFGDQLDTLAAAFGDDSGASAAIDYMQGANAIVEKGMGGDTTAPAELGTYLGDDLATALGKKTPLLMASDSLDC